MGELTNTRNINFLYFAACQTARSVGGTNLTNEFAKLSNIHLVVGSDVSQSFTNSGQLIQPNYLGQSSYTSQPGLRVFWSGVGSPPRIDARYGSMGDLILAAYAAQGIGPGGIPSLNQGGKKKP